MSGRLRVLVPALLVVLVVVVGALLASGLPLDTGPTASQAANGSAAASPGTLPSLEPTIAPTPTPRPATGGTELYGYLPYWQMTSAMATYLRTTPLTTLALFSVTARKTGAINTSQIGYKRIVGSIGRQLIRDAHARGARVDLAFSSFGPTTNARFFGTTSPTATSTPVSTPVPSGPVASARPAPWQRTVDELVALVVELGVDGINVDIEALDPLDRQAYGEFLQALGSALRAAVPGARLSVATEAGPEGVAKAQVAFKAGVDRLFLMGYDYHWSGSQPGATSPVDRTDGDYTLRWSIDQYVEAGVPRDRILLGLPLYGMQWRTAFPDRTSPVIGRGIPWIPKQHVDELAAPGFVLSHDELEHVEYFAVPDGAEFLLTYFDSPATLRLKLALALDNGLAGAGFWAMGYERGAPGYLELMQAFRDGTITREESPPRPVP